LAEAHGWRRDHRPALDRAAFGQQKPAECNTKVPQKVEGQVVSVDQNAGTMTIRDKSGTTHEFKASRETLADMKAGDTIEAKLRKAPNC
jgi:hypothetical protein